MIGRSRHRRIKKATSPMNRLACHEPVLSCGQRRSPWRPAGNGYGPAQKINISLGFSRGPTEGTGHRKRRVLYENSVPSPDERFQGHELLQRKIIFPRALRRVSDFGCFTALGPEGPSPCRVGEF
ncbi:hypothetical protein JTE90_018330 [Oedothorax gibbosus]|uniref:Uncharacterized protein n=1 Tax=Oedothorax gibbosus TaxID=931172 RepID=A0AAV6TH63_9ARAC|nr:hypothetical protein JTE90_018330 [Oedothorax gibbosus]